MSFGAPLFLLALVLVPLAVGLYVLGERRRRARAERFASRPLMPSVAPRGPGFRRHLPIALYLVAAAAIAIALARPEATVAVAEERAAVILTTDISGSMEARDVSPSRMAAVRRAALDLLDDAPGELRVGAVAFNHSVRSIEPPRADRDRHARAAGRPASPAAAPPPARAWPRRWRCCAATASANAAARRPR